MVRKKGFVKNRVNLCVEYVKNCVNLYGERWSKSPRLIFWLTLISVLFGILGIFLTISYSHGSTQLIKESTNNTNSKLDSVIEGKLFDLINIQYGYSEERFSEILRRYFQLERINIKELGRRKEINSTLKLLNKLIEESENAEKEHLLIYKANLLAFGGLDKDAEIVFRQLMIDYPENKDVVRFFANYYYNKGMYSKALDVLSLLRDNKDKDAMILSAMCYVALRNITLAENTINEGFDLFDDVHGFEIAKLDLLYSENKISSAREYATEIRNKNVLDFNTFFFSAKIQRKYNDYSPSVSSSLRATILNPVSYEAWYGAGYSLFNVGEFSLARDLYRACLVIAPKYQPCMAGMGDAYYGLKNIDETIRWFHSCSENKQQEDNLTIYCLYMAGKIYFEQGNYSASYYYLDKGMDIDKEYKDLKNYYYVANAKMNINFWESFYEHNNSTESIEFKFVADMIKSTTILFK